MVTHQTLHNERMIERAFQQSDQSVIVSWLPLYHDMGLIGGMLQPLHLGTHCVLMSPVAFLQRPVRWLQAISRFRATTSGGPNFAYDLCVRKIPVDQRAVLDLSSWQVAFNGSEPIRARRRSTDFPRRSSLADFAVMLSIRAMAWRKEHCWLLRVVIIVQ